jgi:potassium channel subfamily K
MFYRLLPVPWARKPPVAIPSKALLASTLYCTIGGLIFVYVQKLTPTEAVYFMVVTMGTVGYGDIAPKTPGLKVFTVVWILVAIAFVFPQVAGVVGLFTGGWKGLVNRVITWMFPPKLVDINGTGNEDFALPESPALFYAKGLLAVNLLLVLVQLVCAAVYAHFEDWGYGDALYHCIVTATTVGYGDLPIVTDNGKIWCCVHILISVALLGDVIGTFEDVREEAAQREAKVEQGKKKMDPHFTEQVLQRLEMFKKSNSKDGAKPSGISMAEFVLSMLLESGALSEDEIAASKEMFAKADVSGTGSISTAGLQNALNSMQVNLAASVGAVAPTIVIAEEPKPPPPPAPVPPKETASTETQMEPPPTASTHAQTSPPPPTASALVQTEPEPEPTVVRIERLLSAIEAEAIAQLSKPSTAALTNLNAARLSAVKMLIEMQFSIQFQEAKPLSKLLLPTASSLASAVKPIDSGQLKQHRAGKLLSSDAYPEDEKLMLKVCRAVAQVLLVVNRLLDQESLPPLGVRVGGHTSSQTDVSEQLSFNQAKLVSTLIAEELAARDSSYKRVLSEIRASGCASLPNGMRIDSRGYSSTRPLPGYDDGQNHKVNGRVEVRLLGMVGSRPWIPSRMRVVPDHQAQVHPTWALGGTGTSALQQAEHFDLIV